MHFDRFDIVEADYCFCYNYHSGQGCPLYARLCRITSMISTRFHPRLNRFPDTLTDNGREMYDEMVRVWKESHSIPF